MDEPQVVHRPADRVFELVLPDGRVAGSAEYLLTGDEMAITHVVVRPELGGRGYGATLARAALDEASAEGLHVLPLCWFVREQVKRRPEYLQLVPHHARRRFGLAAA